MLILRSTSATRSTVRSAPHLFAAAYPGSSEDAVSALAGPVGDFPVAAIVWIDLRGTHSRVLDGPPRGIALGR
jgi:hypothetical protein